MTNACASIRKGRIPSSVTPMAQPESASSSRRDSNISEGLVKRVVFKLAQKDVFLNIAGGLKVADPALDLAVIAAILSSNVDMSIPHGVCLSGDRDSNISEGLVTSRSPRWHIS